MRRASCIIQFVLATVVIAPIVVVGQEVAPSADSVVRIARNFHRANQAQITRELISFLSLPNVASDTTGIRRNAAALVTLFRRRGFSTELLPSDSGNPPALYAERPGKTGSRTLVLYAHYDGQPAAEATWLAPPWVPVLRTAAVEFGGQPISIADIVGPLPSDARVYARSASDDKAPIIAILAAIDALDAAKIPLGVNLKMFLEGEEEAGSEHLRGILRRNAERLRSDLWIICDGPVHQSGAPQLVFGARGVLDVELSVFGPIRALHSGHYGNWAPNPAAYLADLLSSMRAPNGDILIDGFKEATRPPTAAELEAVSRMPDYDSRLRQELLLAASESKNARLDARLLQPALNIRGFVSGGVAASAANAIPSVAKASIDFRLVPNLDPPRVRALVESHFKKKGFFIVIGRDPTSAERRAHFPIIRADWSDGYPALRTPLTLPASKALVQAVTEARGVAPVLAPTMGASLPLYIIAEEARAPIIALPIVNHDNNQHGPNENVRLQSLWDGVETFAVVLVRLSEVWAAR